MDMKLPLITKVFALLVIVALITIGYMVGVTRRPTSTPPPPPPAQSSPSQTQDVSIQQILNLLQQEFSVSRELVNTHQEWESTSVGRRVPLTGQYFAVNAADTPLLSGHTVVPSSGRETYEIRGSGVTILKEKITAFFTTQGFVRNVQNSNRDEASYSLDETIAFEKGDVACLVTVRTLDPVATFFCGQYDPTYEAVRAEFRTVLNPTGDADIGVDVGKIEGNYARGTVGGRGGGAEWYALKEGEAWKVVFQGQVSPPCSVMEQYRFPKSIYEACDPAQ